MKNEQLIITLVAHGIMVDPEIQVTVNRVALENISAVIDYELRLQAKDNSMANAEKDAVIADLAALVRRMNKRLFTLSDGEVGRGNRAMAMQAHDYLTRKNLIGSPLREQSAAEGNYELGQLLMDATNEAQANVIAAEKVDTPQRVVQAAQEGAAAMGDLMRIGLATRAAYGSLPKDQS